jgi:toxin-antitoxin system PIN domain toxin
MRIELPDVNVLLALLDPMHPHHDTANDWFAGAALQGWATCPLTENGFIRILYSPSYPGMQLRVEEAMSLLEIMIASHAATHHFWPDSISLRDSALFLPAAIAGPKQITDVYLLGLCQQNGGTFVTLDTKVTPAAIVSPRSDLLNCL